MIAPAGLFGFDTYSSCTGVHIECKAHIEGEAYIENSKRI